MLLEELIAAGYEQPLHWVDFHDGQTRTWMGMGLGLINKVEGSKKLVQGLAGRAEGMTELGAAWTACLLARVAG
ncbi:hypothetical protein R6Q59_030434 [Mikania micrantha]